MPTPSCTDLGEHIGAILTIAGVLFGLLVGAVKYIWVQSDKRISDILAASEKRMSECNAETKLALKEIDRKQDEFLKAHYACQSSLPVTYISRGEFERHAAELKADRKATWDDFLKKFEDMMTRFWRHEQSNAKIPPDIKIFI